MPGVSGGAVRELVDEAEARRMAFRTAYNVGQPVYFCESRNGWAWSTERVDLAKLEAAGRQVQILDPGV